MYPISKHLFWQLFFCSFFSINHRLIIHADLSGRKSRSLLFHLRPRWQRRLLSHLQSGTAQNRSPIRRLSHRLSVPCTGTIMRLMCTTKPRAGRSPVLSTSATIIDTCRHRTTRVRTASQHSASRAIARPVRTPVTTPLRTAISTGSRSVPLPGTACHLLSEHEVGARPQRPPILHAMVAVVVTIIPGSWRVVISPIDCEGSGTL
jgi:hypothetical protein